MARKVRPLADRIVVRKEAKTEKKTETGLYIPETAADKGGAIVGEVIDVGEGIYNEKGEFLRPLNVKKGEMVIMGKYAGVDFFLNDEQLLLIQEIDVLGIVED